MDDQREPSPLRRRDFLARGGAGGLALTAGGLLVACGGKKAATTSASPTAGGTPAAGTIQRGGVLRVGVLGGGASDEVLDPHANTVSNMDIARIENVFEKLADISPEGEFVPQLAESFEPNAKADVWTVKLRKGVVFHDGSPLTADDVVYSLRRILDKDLELPGAGALEMVDAKKLRKVDDLTVEIGLNRPWVDLISQLGQRFCSIIKSDTTRFTVKTLNGTGPFKLTAWTPGRKTVMVAHPDYWGGDGPYLDGVTLMGMEDLTARINALQAGQVDAIEQVDPAQVRIIDANDKLSVLRAPGGGWTPIKMDCSRAPYDDVRVRQAFKLLADREKLVKVALQGLGDVGNDVFGVADPLYAGKDIDQRAFDPEKAKSLLTAAGVGDDTFELITSEAAPSMSSSALVYAESAKQAGIKIKVTRKPADGYFSDSYGKFPFQYTDWGYRPLLAQWNLCFNTYNKEETNWSNDRASKLFDEAVGTVDEQRRKDLATEMQQLLWDDGGYILYGFGKRVDALSSRVQGIKPHIFFALGWYQFKDAHLARA